VATFLIIGLVVAQDISKVISYTFGGGSLQCSTCGGKAGEFACSNDIGDWHGGKRDFLDPLSYEDYRNGYRLTRLTLTTSGTYDCYGRAEGAIISTSINDESIEVKAKTGAYKCECGRCDGTLAFTSNFNVGGFPGFRYGTYNVLSISTFNDAICLKDVTLNLTYNKPNTNSTSFFLLILILIITHVLPVLVLPENFNVLILEQDFPKVSVTHYLIILSLSELLYNGTIKLEVITLILPQLHISMLNLLILLMLIMSVIISNPIVMIVGEELYHQVLYTSLVFLVIIKQI